MTPATGKKPDANSAKTTRQVGRPPPFPRTALLLAVAAVVVYGWFFFGRGLDVPDEGLLLHVAERLAEGQVPYRDVYFIYTPGFQYLLAGLFRVFGPDLAVERALRFAVHVALVLLVYALAARFAWRPLAIAAALVVVVSGVNPYRTLMGLIAVWALTRYAASGRKGWLAASGALIGASYLVGQEIGVYALAAALGYLGFDWLVRPDRRGGLARLAGRVGLVLGTASAVLAPWLGILVAQGALPAMVDDTLRVTFLHQPRYMHVPLPPLLPFVPDDLSANVVWGPPHYLLYVKLMLYLPIATVAAALGVIGASVLAQGPRGEARLVVPLALFASMALGTLVFRADYYHLRQGLPVTLVLLAWLLTQLRGGARRRGAPRWAAASVLLPFAVILAVSLGEAGARRAELSAPLETTRGTVLVDAATARGLGGLLRALEARTAPDEPIYVAPAETAVYFLANRRNPTLFGQLVPTETELLREHDGARQRDLIAAVERAGVRWVVTANLDNVNGVPFADYAPLIAAYLDSHFVPETHFGYWTLQRRR